MPLLDGQKTGWFFDQAANRRALTKYVRKGARVLDVFSYVGAWGVRAAHGGAGEVTCVDASATALQLALANAERNGLAVAARKGDAFDVLEALIKEKARFDLVIVDPPAFAKRRKDLPKALAAYKRLNQLAMQLLANEGILVSCSCSYHVSEAGLQDAIAKAARATQRHVQILEFGGQAPDHPGPSRHFRDPLSESLFLSCRRRFKVIHADLPAHQSRRHLHRSVVRHRTVAGALVRDHVPNRLRCRLGAGALPGAPTGLHLERHWTSTI